MFGVGKSKHCDVLSHWYIPVPTFSLSPQTFYAAVEGELAEQKVPGLGMSREEFSEGGLLSDKRVYLRMTRERLVFDICAAPFGTNYFFSCRFAEIPRKVSLGSILILIALGFLFFLVSLKILGLLLTFLFGPVLAAVSIYLLRNLVSLGLSDVDAALLKSPVLGAIYENYFRKDTYYRQDTRLMYLSVVESVVKELIERETAAKGIKLLVQYEYAPILGELYKPRPFGRSKPESTEEELSRHVSI